MGLRLLISGWWTPKYIIRRELRNISLETITALEALMPKQTFNGADYKTAKMEKSSVSSIEEARAAMAQTQAELVATLEAAIGRDETVKLGRQALFAVGENLGKQTRSKLGVGGNPQDLVRAAKILYRVLGIDFHMEWIDESNAVAVIDRCALAGKYSQLTCEVLSATDEGVIKGLQPNVTMKFTEYMTSGCKNCKAVIKFNGGGRLS